MALLQSYFMLYRDFRRAGHPNPDPSPNSSPSPSPSRRARPCQLTYLLTYLVLMRTQASAASAELAPTDLLTYVVLTSYLLTFLRN